MRRIISGGLLSVVAVPAVLAVPVLPVPGAEAEPHPVAPRVQVFDLGSAQSPTGGAVSQRERPPDAPVDDDAAGTAAARPTSENTLMFQRETTEEFSAVAVTWARDPLLTPVSMAVRAKSVEGGEPAADTPWGTWHTVGAAEDDGPGQNTGRGAADLLWLGRSRGIEFALTSFGEPSPAEVRLELIDPQESAADTGPSARPTGRAHAAMAMPMIRRRAEWGADESKMTWPPQYSRTLKAAVLHHTASSNNYTAADVPKILRSVYHFHAVSRGWGDIGYNALVDKFGRLWEGRVGGLVRPVVGAHAGGFNSATTGISMIGDYMKVSVPKAVVEGIANYVAWKFSFYGIDPAGTTKLSGGPNTKYDKAVTVTVPRIYPHQGTNSTDCPGRYGLAALQPIRQRARALIGTWRNQEAMRMRLAVWRPSDRGWYVRGEQPVTWSDPGDVPVPADYTGDGTDDLAMWSPGLQQWRVRGRPAVTWGSTGHIPVPADYNGDGAAEIAVWSPASFKWYVRGRRAVPFGQPGDIPAPGDYDGDGRSEIALFRPGTETWHFYGRRRTVHWGSPWHVPVPADYDGDGDTDIAVYSPVSFTWFIQGTKPLVFGAGGDKPLPGQYNGDGKADVALWRPSDGSWQIRNIGTYVFGRSGDIPVTLR